MYGRQNSEYTGTRESFHGLTTSLIVILALFLWAKIAVVSILWIFSRETIRFINYINYSKIINKYLNIRRSFINNETALMFPKTIFVVIKKNTPTLEIKKIFNIIWPHSVHNTTRPHPIVMCTTIYGWYNFVFYRFISPLGPLLTFQYIPPMMRAIKMLIAI